MVAKKTELPAGGRTRPAPTTTRTRTFGDTEPETNTTTTRGAGPARARMHGATTRTTNEMTQGGAATETRTGAEASSETRTEDTAIHASAPSLNEALGELPNSRIGARTRGRSPPLGPEDEDGTQNAATTKEASTEEENAQ